MVNQILDFLPENIWKDRNATFLDPVSKSGVFLREIAKRLLRGLEKEIPDLQDHQNVFLILHFDMINKKIKECKKWT